MPLAAIAAFVLFFGSAMPGVRTRSVDCEVLAAAKKATYGFQPSKLSKAAQSDKSKLMDEFWNLVKAAGPEGLRCVSQLIADEKLDSWFLFDAASLLAAFDRSGASDAAIAQGLLGTSFEEIDPAAYLSVALALSQRNFDIGPVAHAYMSASKVTAYLPQHGGYKVERTEGAILLYGSMSPSMADAYLAKEIASQRQEVRDAAAIVWSLNMTEASFKAMAGFGKMSQFSESVRTHVRTVLHYRPVAVTRPAKHTRDQILALIAKWPDLGDISPEENRALDNSVYATLTIDDLPALREGRRRLVRGVSNESVDSFDEVSRMLMNLINALDAYKEYRVH